MTSNTQLVCGCGQFHLEVERAPIISTECHCNSCRAAGVRLQALPAVPPFVEANGGTRFVLYRKDRIRFVKGGDLLREFRLAPGANTGGSSPRVATHLCSSNSRAVTGSVCISACGEMARCHRLICGR